VFKESCIFLQYVPENISGAFIMWYWCPNHFRILFIHQLDIIDCRKLKIEVGVAYICMTFILNFVQISHLVQEFGKVSCAWRA
jgi:hypothetical protein